MSTELLVVSHGFQSHYELGVSNGLAENGVPVTLLGSDTTLVDRLHPGVKYLNLRGSQDETRPRRLKALGWLRYHLRLMLLSLRQPRNPMLIIGLLRPEWFLGLLQCSLFRMTGRPVALMVHNILPHDRHTRSMRWMYWCIYRLPTRLLVHAESTRRDLISQFGIDAGRIVQVRHGRNEAVECQGLDTAEAKKSLGLHGNTRTLIFFGHVSPFKCLEVLLDALELLPDTTLIVAGRCPPDDYGQAMRGRLTGLRQRGRVKWFDGYVDEVLIARLFAAADLTVLPYRHIDQSAVLLQSLSLGVPVACTRVGGLGETVNEHNGVFIEALTAQAVADAVRSYFGRRRPLSRQGVRSTVAELAWSHTLQPFIASLPAMRSRRPSPRVQPSLRGDLE